jgi:hypothetical protein
MVHQIFFIQPFVRMVFMKLFAKETFKAQV